MVYLAKNCGTCKGKTNLLGLIYEIYEKEIKKDNPKKICLYKVNLNNDLVIKELKELGIICTDDLSEVKADDIVISGTNGLLKEEENFLTLNNIEYYKGTCEIIVKLKEEVDNYLNDGYQIVFVGNCKTINLENITADFIRVNNSDDLVKIDNNKNIYLINNDSINKSEDNNLITLIKNTFKDIKIVINDCICKNLFNMYKETVKLSEKVDVMFFIGKNDCLCEEINKHTLVYNFSDILDFYKFIKKEDLKKYLNIGLCSDNDVPIKEVYNYKYLLEFFLFYQDKLQTFINKQGKINNKLYRNDHELITEVIDDFCDLNQDGKYIRATLIALGYLASSKSDTEEFLDLAYAYEMFQTSVLIHDDIIDNAKLRRGKDTIPRRICKKYLNLKNDKEFYNDCLVLANSLGICTGDLGFYEANNIIIESYKNHPALPFVLKYFNDIVISTIKGEILDVYLPFKNRYLNNSVNEDDILNIYELKTALYTIVGPFNLGYLLGGHEINEQISQVLNKIGIAFQLKDDLLGIFQDSQVLGKSNVSDIEEYKQTILYAYVMNTPYQQQFLKIYGKKHLTENDIATLKNILITSGAYEYANNYLNNLYIDIINMLDELDIDNLVVDILKGLMIYINIREK